MKIVSVDVSTGIPCSDFGNNGVIVVPQNNSFDHLTWQLRNPPVVLHGLIAIAPMVRDSFMQNITKGPTWAFDAATGARKWTFHPIPIDKNDSAYSTWENGTANIGGGNAWPPMSADPELKIIYMSTGSPTVDFFGGGRHGANNYTSALVAVDSETGKIRWAFQIVHHDIWDQDVCTPPTIVNFRNRKIVIVGTKVGMLWMLDAINGNPIFGYEERPVPRSHVPGELAYPTQPFPLPRTLQLLPEFKNENDMWGPNESARDFCVNRLKSLTGRQQGHFYTPISTNGSLLNYGNIGGMSWGGCTVNPLRGAVTCVVKSGQPLAAKLFPRNATIDPWCLRTHPQYGTPYTCCLGFMMSPGEVEYPCSPPPWTELVRLDISTGAQIWRRTYGYVPHPGFSRNWGSFEQRGSGVTETLGGILFVSGTLDNHLWGFDATTGNEIFSAALPNSAFATPITYRVKDTQYVVIVTTNMTNEEVIAWSLPNPNTLRNDTDLGVVWYLCAKLVIVMFVVCTSLFVYILK